MYLEPKPHKDFIIAPSLLSADFAQLKNEIDKVTAAGADWIHVDVMDGHFVPNLTIGAPVVRSLRPITRLPLDVHLMIEKPERYVDVFAEAGADYLTIHVEATDEVEGTLRKIREKGLKPGVTLRPKTPVEKVLPWLPQADLVLVMTVEPGFGGQSFMHDQIDKIKVLRREIELLKRPILIEVDGGINAETAPLVRDADVLVAGNYIFKNDYKTAIANLKKAKL